MPRESENQKSGDCEKWDEIWTSDKKEEKFRRSETNGEEGKREKVRMKGDRIERKSGREVHFTSDANDKSISVQTQAEFSYAL